jgi:hypothetical protein
VNNTETQEHQEKNACPWKHPPQYLVRGRNRLRGGSEAKAWACGDKDCFLRDFTDLHVISLASEAKGRGSTKKGLET